MTRRDTALLRYADDHQAEIAGAAALTGVDVDQLTDIERAEITYRLLITTAED